MTTTHVDFDSNIPAGSDNPTDYSADNLSNLRALRDLIIAGLVPGFVHSRTNGTGTADQPQYVSWYNATLGIGFRWHITWTATKPTSVLEEWTNDFAAAWIAVGSAQVNTFDASNNITASTQSGGWVTMFFEVWAKCLKVIADLVAHAAAVGAAVHGLGDISTQNKAACDFDGGTADGMTFGGSVRCVGNFTRATEDHATHAPGAAAGVVIDWSKGSSSVTNNGVNALTFSNVPASGRAGHVIDLTNLNNTTFPGAVDWGVGGKPSIAGAVTVGLLTRDGGTTYRASVLWSAV